MQGRIGGSRKRIKFASVNKPQTICRKRGKIIGRAGNKFARTVSAGRRTNDHIVNIDSVRWSHLSRGESGRDRSGSRADVEYGAFIG